MNIYRKSRKKLFFLFAVCMMMLLNTFPVFAAPEKGSIEIELTDGDVGTSKEGVTFEYAKVADLSGGQYYLLDKYSDVDINLNDIDRAVELDEAANNLNEYVVADGNVVTDKEGYATISDLEIGVYLLRVSDKAGYENVTPVLVAIPTWNEVDGDMEYDVTVIPKHSPNTPGTIITGAPNVTDGGVNTGDSNSPTLYGSLGLCSVMAIFMVLYAKKESKFKGRNRV